MVKFAKGINSKICKGQWLIFFKFSPGNQLITVDQLSKFEARSFNGFPDIKFLFQNLQRAITQKN